LPNSLKNEPLDIDLSWVDFDDESDEDDVTGAPPTLDPGQELDNTLSEASKDDNERVGAKQLSSDIDDQLLATITDFEAVHVSNLELASLLAREKLIDALEADPENPLAIASAKERYMDALKNQLNFHEFLAKKYASFLTDYFKNRLKNEPLLSKAEIAKVNSKIVPVDVQFLGRSDPEIGIALSASLVRSYRKAIDKKFGLGNIGEDFFRTPARMRQHQAAVRKLASELDLPEGWEPVLDDYENALDEISKIPGRMERRAAYKAYALDSRPRHFIVKHSDPALNKHDLMFELDSKDTSLIATPEEVRTVLNAFNSFNDVINLSNLQGVRTDSLLGTYNRTGGLKIIIGNHQPISKADKKKIGTDDITEVIDKNNGMTSVDGRLYLNLANIRKFDDKEYRIWNLGRYWRSINNSLDKLAETLKHELGHQVMYAVQNMNDHINSNSSKSYRNEINGVKGEYGDSNYNENFAESVARFVSTGEASDRIKNILSNSGLVQSVSKQSAAQSSPDAPQAEGLKPTPDADAIPEKKKKKSWYEGLGTIGFVDEPSTYTFERIARLRKIKEDNISSIERDLQDELEQSPKAQAELLGYLEDTRNALRGLDYIENYLKENGLTEVEATPAVMNGTDELFDKPENKLTDEEKEALLSYKGKGYISINEVLRKPDVSVPGIKKAKSDIANIDSAFEKQEPTTVPKFLNRGISGKAASIFSRLSPGDIYEETGYMSTTSSLTTANNFAVATKEGRPAYLTITVPAGAKMIRVYKYTPSTFDEAEFLLPRGSKLRINSIEKSDVIYVEAEVVLDDAPQTEQSKPAPDAEAQTIPSSLDNLGIDFQSATMDASGTRLPTPGAFTGKFQDIMKGAKNWKEVQERLKGQTVTYFDFETTGIADYDGQDITNDPVQLGAVQVKDGKIVKRFNVYINPESRLSEWSSNNLKRDVLDSEGNRILDDYDEFKQELVDSEWLSRQSSQEQALKDFIEFIGPNALLGGQNVPFDIEILKRMADKSGIDLDIAGTIDSKDLASLLPKYDAEKGIDGPKAPDRKTGEIKATSSLGPVANFLGFEPANWHSADGDAEDSYNLVSKIIDRAANEDNQDLSLLDFPAMQKRYEERMAEFKAAVDPNNPITENQQKALQRMSESKIPWISQKAKDAISSASTRGEAAKALQEINAGNWEIVDGIGIKGKSDIFDKSLSKFIFDTYKLPRSAPDVDLKEFTPEEKAAIKYYTGEGYKKINEYLINNMEPKSEFLDNEISKLNEVLKKHKYAKDGVVYRGMTPPENTEKKLKYYEMLENLEPGSVVSNVSYTSTSSEPEIAAKNFAGSSFYRYSDDTYSETSFNSDSGQFGGSFWSISIPKGSTAFEVPRGLDEYWFDEAEAETILPSGARLKIKAIRRVPFGSNLKPGFATYVNDNYKYYIDAELIEDVRPASNIESLSSNKEAKPTPDAEETPEKSDLDDVMDNYRMSHRPASREDAQEEGAAASLDKIDEVFPKDILDPAKQRNYSSGYPDADKEAFDVINSIKGNPDAEVTIYRGAPSDVDDIQPGDWVSLSSKYAQTHIDSNVPGGKVLSKKVKASDLFTSADSIQEWGWDPAKPAPDADEIPSSSPTKNEALDIDLSDFDFDSDD
jgi:DNA polymerase III epsilon subunit-like protein